MNTHVTAPTPKPALRRAVAGGAPATSLRWLGQSSFLLTSASGTKVLMDPIPKGYGYDGPALEGIDVITITHDHPDHVNVSLAAGNPPVLRGLSGGDWAKIEQKVNDVSIRTVGAFHDGTQGSQRGKDAIFIIEADGLRIVHLGDLGHTLTPEQVSAVGPVDVLLIPVGGFYTIDATQATQVMGQLRARVAIPIHFKTPKIRPDWPGVGVDDFLMGKKVERAGASTYTFSKHSLPQETTVKVLDPE